MISLVLSTVCFFPLFSVLCQCLFCSFIAMVTARLGESACRSPWQLGTSLGQAELSDLLPGEKCLRKSSGRQAGRQAGRQLDASVPCWHCVSGGLVGCPYVYTAAPLQSHTLLVCLSCSHTHICTHAPTHTVLHTQAFYKRKKICIHKHCIPLRQTIHLHFI